MGSLSTWERPGKGHYGLSEHGIGAERQRGADPGVWIHGVRPPLVWECWERVSWLKKKTKKTSQKAAFGLFLPAVTLAGVGVRRGQGNPWCGWEEVESSSCGAPRTVSLVSLGTMGRSSGVNIKPGQASAVGNPLPWASPWADHLLWVHSLWAAPCV